MDAAGKARSSLSVVQGEEDKQAEPDAAYFQMLQKLIAKGVLVSRYYFGSKKQFEIEKSRNPGIVYWYGGNMQAYQRAVIIDGKKAFFKIGNVFAVTEYSELVKLLEDYLSGLI